MLNKSFGFPKLGVVAAAVLLLSGCATAAPSASQTPLLDDFESDVQKQVVLTVAGNEFSLADLAQRGSKSLEILEPFSKVDTEFTVISMSDLLIENGFSDADSVVTIALNDYRYTDTVAAFTKNNALLAIYENGEPIAISDGGPVRIVFDESSDYYQNLDAWNWSLSSIELAGE